MAGDPGHRGAHARGGRGDRSELVHRAAKRDLAARGRLGCQELALAATETSNLYGKIAAAEDFDTFFELYNSADTTAVFKASTAAAETVRADLGLESVTTAPPDWCTLVKPS